VAKVGRDSLSVALAVTRLPHADGLELPAYQSAQASGLDLVAAVDAKKPLSIKPGRHALVPTGLKIEVPDGYEGQVRPRSGLAAKHGLTVLNTPGTIDADYRGEVQVLLVNLGRDKVKINRGDRIAQLVIAPVVRVGVVETAGLGATRRGEGGFGSTGKRRRRKPANEE
jgi:dUTP pyrophosphatase